MTDAEFIDALGGPRELAELLGYDLTRGGWQRVNNWRRRGIPSKVQLERADVLRQARKRILARTRNKPTKTTAAIA
jgi:hypothetical protein